MNQEHETLQQSQSINELLLEMLKNQKKNQKNMLKLYAVTIICYTVILLSMVFGFFWYESQFEVYEQVVTETTVTQEVSGEGSEINNVEGNMYKGTAIHNEGE